jgi:hypothetical protein
MISCAQLSVYPLRQQRPDSAIAIICAAPLASNFGSWCEMSNNPFVGRDEPQTIQLMWTLGLIGSSWIVSDLGYYFLLPALGLSGSYSTEPSVIALYYAIWVVIVIALLKHRFQGWRPFENGRFAYIFLPLSFGAFTLFAAYALPLLPQVSWTEPWHPPEIRIATAWYFLPKSVEVLFQQLLIVTLVLALSAQRCSLLKISVCCSILFGGTHALLAFGGLPARYVIRSMVAGSAFGCVFPYFLLRVRNGFAYSYIVHWLYYAISVALPHILLANTK